jgi:hypothetical protein
MWRLKIECHILGGLLYSDYKRKTTKYKDYFANLVTIFDFQIDELIIVHEALIGSKGEHWKETIESKHVSLLKN